MLALAKQLEIGPYLLWIGVCLVVIIGASLAVLWYRRHILNPPAPDHHGGLLDELRAMKQRGELSEQEFAAAKHAMVARLAGNAAPPPPPVPARPVDRIARPGFDLTGQPLPRPPEDTPGV